VLFVAIIGLAMTAVAVVLVARRVLWLHRLATVGPPAPERVEYAKTHLAEEVKAQLVEVFGQRKLLRWSVPGLAHFFTFWAFVILITVYVEAYGALFDHDFHIPLYGFLIFSSIGAGVILLLLTPMLKKLMHGVS